MIAFILRTILFTLLCALNSGIGFASEQPNIILIVCDDLGYADLECFGHQHIKTPNINKLAANGIRFTHCYTASPICSPARVGLLTGRHPNRAGVYGWISQRKIPQPDAVEQVHLRKTEITIPMLLKSAKYSTFMAGKWHCNSRFNEPEVQSQPNDAGFEHWLATQGGALPSHRNPGNFVRNGAEIGPVPGFSCDIVVNEAIAWMTQHAQEKQGNPFFAYVAFHEPHEPVESPVHLINQYLPVSANKDEATYFACVSNIDNAVGRLLTCLEEIGETENTLVVFTSDNGPERLNRHPMAFRSYGRPGSLRGWKLSLREGGIRVPSIVSYPRDIKNGQVIDTPVSLLDLLPTFCELADVELPQRTLDGISLVPLFSSGALKRKQQLFWVYFDSPAKPKVAMRDGNYKILAQLRNGKRPIPRRRNLTPKFKKQLAQSRLTDFEIYDVVSDPGEKQNLENSKHELLAKMKKTLTKHYTELLNDSPVWNPADAYLSPLKN